MQLVAAIRRLRLAASVACGVMFLVASMGASYAQEPPLDVPITKLGARDPNAIAVEGWLLYPTLRTYSVYSDNVFGSPVGPISAGALGLNPALTAEWTNGIHSTTLYGDIDRQTYPTQTQINTLDGHAGFTQRYEAMRDLNFTVNGNYQHQTWATGLQNAIQAPIVAPATTVLADGNTVLPNGTILSPSGQAIGQVNQTTASNLPLQINPANRYTGSFTVDKIFNRGILSLSALVNRTDYESQTILGDSRGRTFTEHGGVWLGPLLYAYSDGALATQVTGATLSTLTSSTTTSYRILGGLGTRQFGLWKGSAYYGHQGSESSNAATIATANSSAGGEIYGGSISYLPTQQLSFTGTVDRTTNRSSNNAATDLALTLPTIAAIQVPINASTAITATSVQSNYQITALWLAAAQLGYTRIEYIGTSRIDSVWLFDTTLRYDIRHNVSIDWEYRYRDIISDVPFTSARSNYVMMGTTYRF